MVLARYFDCTGAKILRLIGCQLVEQHIEGKDGFLLQNDQSGYIDAVAQL